MAARKTKQKSGLKAGTTKAGATKVGATSGHFEDFNSIALTKAQSEKLAAKAVVLGYDNPMVFGRKIINSMLSI